MKVLLCVHGYPPEMWGGTEVAARNLAEGLAARGQQVIVVAGSWLDPKPGEVAIRTETHEGQGGGPVRVERWTRPDLHFDHWHKARSARVAAAFRELLRREQPDVVHVLHWLRLSRDLVQVAAQEGIPALVSLGDSWVSCPLTFRVRPDTHGICEEVQAPMTCIRCTAQVPPRTPWVPMEASFMTFADREQGLARELELARTVLIPGESFGARQRRGMNRDDLKFEVQAPCGVPKALQRGTAMGRAGDDPLRLGCWGQLSRLKGTDLLFEAIAGLQDPGRVQLELAGPESEPDLLGALRARHPDVQVAVHGPYTTTDLPEHPVSSVHAMVSASRAPESFGIVLEEARALGLPAVLPDAGAFAERGGSSRGCLMFEPGDAGSLRAAISRLLDEPTLLEDLHGMVPAALVQQDVTDQHLAHYERAIALGPPEDVPAHEWYADRLALFAEEEWDRSLAATPPEDPAAR